MLHREIVLGFVLFFVFIGTLQAEEEKRDKNRYEDEDIVVRVIPRNKENIIAFYQGRDFPQRSYDEINKVCYVTFLIRNKSQTIHWLELDNWRFIGKEEGFKRLDREYWKQRWTELKLPQSFQATFGWSLLPEVRDLHHDEPVGGSTTLTFSKKPFDVELVFKLGQNKDKGEKRVRFNDIQCKE